MRKYRLIDDATNTICTKTVYDLVTDTKIKPDPFVFSSMENINVKRVPDLTYIKYPLEISIEKAYRYLEIIKIC